MFESRDEVTREVPRERQRWAASEWMAASLQAVGGGVVTEGRLDVGLASELPQRGGEAP